MKPLLPQGEGWGEGKFCRIVRDIIMQLFDLTLALSYKERGHHRYIKRCVDTLPYVKVQG